MIAEVFEYDRGESCYWTVPANDPTTRVFVRERELLDIDSTESST